MSAQRFSTGNRFHWQDGVYEIKRWFPGEGKVSLEHILTGAIQSIDLLVLVRALFDGELRFVDGQHTGVDESEDIGADRTGKDLADYLIKQD